MKSGVSVGQHAVLTFLNLLLPEGKMNVREREILMIGLGTDDSFVPQKL